MGNFTWSPKQSGGGGGSGEANTTSNLGTGEGIAAPKAGVNLPMKSIKAGANVTVTANANEITIASSGGGGSGEANTASKIGTGAGLVAPKSGVDLPFKSIKAGANVTVSESATEVTITSTATGSGEANTASNLGSGEGIAATKSGVNLPFKSIKAGPNATVTADANEITIAAAAPTTDAAALTTGSLANARVPASNVTQHQGALQVTESQVTDLKAYALTTAVQANTTLIGAKYDKPGLSTTAASGANHAFDLDSSRTHKLVLTANCTVTLINAEAGETFDLILVQDATGGRNITWPANVKWPGNTAPTLTATANAVDLVRLVFDGTDFFATIVKGVGTSTGGGGGGTTQKSGTIAASETWSGTVQVTADVKIEDAATITIQPGTIVEFAGNFWLEVLGDIQAVGNSSNRIQFKPASGVASWYGIIFGANNGGFSWGQAKKGTNPRFQFCDFVDSSKLTRVTIGDRHHLRGGAIGYNQGDAITIEDCTFTRCKAIQQGGGVYINGGSLAKPYAIRRCTFTDCQGDYASAFKQDHGASMTIEGCSFSGAVTSDARFTNIAVTVDVATDVFTAPQNQFMKTGSPVKFIGGTMPGGIVQNQAYFAIVVSSTTFKVATTAANANAGTAVNVTSAGANVKATTNHDWLVFDASATIS